MRVFVENQILSLRSFRVSSPRKNRTLITITFNAFKGNKKHLS